MPWNNEHIKWLVKVTEELKTADGKNVDVLEFKHTDCVEVLASWAKHIRNHYCLDSDIDFLRGQLTRKDYLNNIKFPCLTSNLGPAIMAGDFGEILIADYLQFIMDCWVPRIRWGSKVVRDESLKGSDVIGFRYQHKDKSLHDVLVVFEAKTMFSSSGKNRLQDAINDSAKDHLRIDESLNFIKQKLFERNDIEQAQRIERFQSPVDMPYEEIYGAAAIISDEHFDPKIIIESDCNKVPKSQKSLEYVPHQGRDRLVLLVIKGSGMMNLARELYRRAADEA